MASDPRIGAAIAGYRIESLIGRGGMSVVYLARHEGLERNAALKLLAPELAENDAFRRRFIRESRLAAGLDHPNVIPVFDAGEADGILYIAMRYVRGSDLRSLLAQRGPLPAADVVRAMDQLGAALDAAHEQGLVHRDVKPANVLLSPPTPPALVGHLYLADFGLTKRSLSGSGVTKSGQFVGTIDYVAPEQIRSDPVDGRTDVYSLGCVLYECLTGEPPFPRDTEVAVMFSHLNDPPPRPSAVRAGLPPEIDDVVAMAMAKDPDDRYRSAGETAAAAREALEVAATTIASPASGRPAAPEPPRRRRPGRAIVVGGVAATLVAIAMVVALVTGGGSGQPLESPGASGTLPATASASSGPTTAGLAAGFLGLARLTVGGDVAEAFPLSLGPMPAPAGVTARRPMLAGEGSVWVAGGGLDDTRITKVDPNTGEPTDLLLRTGGTQTLSFAQGQSSLWVLTFGGIVYGQASDDLFRIDPGSDRIVADIRVAPAGVGAVGVAIGREGIWVLRSDGVLLEIDSGRNRVTQTIQNLPGANGIAVGGGAIWVTNAIEGQVYRVTPATGKWKTLQMPGGADGIAADAGGIWILDRSAGQVVQLDPATGSTGQQIRVGELPSSIAVAQGFVWVTSPTEGTVWRVDESSGQPTSFHVGGDPGPGYVSVGEGGVWTTVG